MGRRNKAYYKDLHQQAYDKLVGMQAFGESKRAAVVAGTDKEKIFSFNTYKSYWKHTKYFIQYIKEHHPECTTLKSARKYVNEWLQARADQGPRPWASCTAFLPMMKTTSSPQSGTGRISSGAAATGCATGTFPRPTTTS